MKRLLFIVKYSFAFCFIISCAESEAPVISKKGIEEPQSDLYILKEKTPIIRENFYLNGKKQIVNLNSKEKLIIYKLGHDSITEDTVIKASLLFDTKNIKNYNKDAAVEISNYYYHQKEDKYYLICKIPLAVDSAYQGMTATFYVYEYWLNEYKGQDFSLIDKKNITDVINDINITNDAYTTHAYPEVGFYADSKKIIYSVYKDAGLYNSPYLTYHYSLDSIIIPNPISFKKIIKDTLSFSKKAKYSPMKFISAESVIFYPEKGKNFLFNDSITIFDRKLLFSDQELTVLSDQNKLYMGTELIYEYPENTIPIYANTNLKDNLIYVLSKDHSNYYYNAISF